MPPVVKTVETDGNGAFDFGPLRIGHYTLTIDGEDSFDIEIKELPQATESVTIDVSLVSMNSTQKLGDERISLDKRGNRRSSY